MKQKGWILLAVLLLLVALTFVRERFEATPSIKAPPYDDAEKLRIRNMMSKADLDALRAEMKRTSGNAASNELIEMQIEGFPWMIVGHFFTTVYRPAQAPITDADIRAFFEEQPLSDASPLWKDIAKRLLKTYFIDQSGVGTSVNTGYATDVTELGQLPGYLGAGLAPKNGTTSPLPLGGTTGPPVAANGGIVNVPGGGMGTLTGSSTGGSSTSSMGPTSGNSSTRSKQVFGPVFTSRGEGGGSDGGDSTKTNNYPELMGGQSTTASTKIPGAGIVSPSKNWLLTMDGSLPSWDSLGASDMSKFVPTSRTPGDMDLIPDPYRLSRNFSTSSYSSKTEPAPFLTDFSAFLK